MVDSRQKGYRAEAALKKYLTDITELNWQRIPASGALDEVHGLKGDLYIPNTNNRYCVEVKSYKDPAVNHLLLSGVGKPLVEWIGQAIRQGEQVDKEPLLIFKHDRSTWFVCFWGTPKAYYKNISYNYDILKPPVYIATLEEWLINEEVDFIK